MGKVNSKKDADADSMQVWANKIIKTLYGKAQMEFNGGCVRMERNQLREVREEDEFEESDIDDDDGVTPKRSKQKLTS